MGREIRMVPKGWEHPKYPADYCEPHLRGRYVPLHGRSFAQEDADWNEGYAKWQDGFVQSYSKGESPDDYMPDWPKAERTHLVMYEDTSEGTPISPAFKTPEELARWLTDNGASSFGSSTATYEQWLSMCKRGWAPSMVVASGRIMSGVEFLSESAR